MWPSRFRQNASVRDSIAKSARSQRLTTPTFARFTTSVPDYLVMELVEGKTPAGPLTVETALNYARQIADGLEAAHEKGIIHRDLKPANIKITPEGVVKILDFGLAKSVAVRTGESVTVTAGQTELGLAVGTPGYMSPEQARGEEVDRRTDIWAYGCVLFELLTGHRAFSGKGSAERVVAILSQEPNWNLLPAETPAALRKVLRRCLAKERKRRYQHIGDVRLELDEPFDFEVQAVPPRRSPTAFWIGALVLTVIVGLALGHYWGRSNHAEAEVWSSELLGGANQAIGPRVSPDGQTLAFQAMIDGMNQVEVLKVASGDSLVLTKDKTSGIINDISWSTDGTRLFYDRYGKAALRHLQHPDAWRRTPAGPRKRLRSAGGRGWQPCCDACQRETAESVVPILAAGGSATGVERPGTVDGGGMVAASPGLSRRQRSGVLRQTPR